MIPEKPQKLGEILIQAGIIDKLQLNTALKYQKEWDRKLGESLVELGFISESTLCKVLSKFLNVPHVELAQVRINPAALQRVPKRLADKYGLIPIDLQGEGPHQTLMLAMIDPTNLVAIDEAAFTSGCKVIPVVATHTEIEKSIRRHYGDERVVDIFFESPNPHSVTSQMEIERLEPRELVFDNRGVAHDAVPKFSQSTLTLNGLGVDTLTRALISLLIKKGYFSEDDLLNEVREA